MRKINAIGCSALGIGVMLLLLASNAAADAAQGKAIYEGKGACLSCHGPGGKGKGPAAAALDPKPRDFSKGDFVIDTDADGETGTDTDLFNVIHDGAAKYGGAATMPGRPDLSDEEINALVDYVRTLHQ